MNEQTSTPAKVEEGRPGRWDPFERLNQMQSEFDRFFAERWPLRRMTEVSGTWAPRADVYEQNGSIVVKAELPGMKKEDIEVKVDDGDLVIRGERSTEEKVEEKDFYRMERSRGSIYRRFPLPQGVAPDQIKADYSDGVLKVTVPKPASATPAQTMIPVK